MPIERFQSIGLFRLFMASQTVPQIPLCYLPPIRAVSMPTAPTKSPPRRCLINTLSDPAGTRTDEKYGSTNLEFPTLDKPFREKDSACQSDPDVDPLASVVVVAAGRSVVSAGPPGRAVLHMAKLIRPLACYPSHVIGVEGRGCQ